MDIEQLKHLILYCESLAAPDPLVGWAEITIREYNAGVTPGRQESAEISSIIRQLSVLQPIIDGGMLQFFPPFSMLGVDTGASRHRHLEDQWLASSEEFDITKERVLAAEAQQASEEASLDDDPEDTFFSHLVRRPRKSEMSHWDSDQSRLEPYDYIVDLWSHENATALGFYKAWAEIPFLSSLIIRDAVH